MGFVLEQGQDGETQAFGFWLLSLACTQGIPKGSITKGSITKGGPKGAPWAPLGPLGGPKGPLGAPKGPLGAPVGPLGPPWAPGKSLGKPTGHVNSKTCQKINFWAFLGPTWVKKKCGFRPRDPHGEIRAGILCRIPVLKSQMMGWRPIW